MTFPNVSYFKDNPEAEDEILFKPHFLCDLKTFKYTLFLMSTKKSNHFFLVIQNGPAYSMNCKKCATAQQLRAYFDPKLCNVSIITTACITLYDQQIRIKSYYMILDLVNITQLFVEVGKWVGFIFLLCLFVTIGIFSVYQLESTIYISIYKEIGHVLNLYIRKYNGSLITFIKYNNFKQHVKRNPYVFSNYSYYSF